MSKQYYKNAFECEKFKMYLQFIVDTNNGCLVGTEALARLQDEDKGILSPISFLSDLKGLEMIGQLDFYILDKVCKQLEEWNNTKMSKLSISSNFTRSTLSSPDFIEKFSEIISKYKFDHSRLIIEITEDLQESHFDVCRNNIVKCKEFGCRVALDDFGSGYSSFCDLCEYPIDIIKFDRRVIQKTSAAKVLSLFKGITELAHKFGIKVLCEGVETESELERVTSTGCDYIQGYYYSKPIPVECACEFYNNF